jgi:hypothetical protein
MKTSKKTENKIFTILMFAYLTIQIFTHWNDVKKGAVDGYNDANGIPNLK